MAYVTPELIAGTGGVESAVGALIACRSAVHYGDECMNCLDAPTMMPAGSTRQIVPIDGRAPYAAPAMTYRDGAA